MTREDKLNLYYKAKEAYYNGQEIMTDYEFDALEKELGLENKAQVGARHNPSYTQKHPFVMGSLSKVQIHKDKEGNIDWKKYFTEAAKYFGKHEVIITPKFDGCSFECEIKDGKLIQISSRGDGEYGKDLTLHLVRFVPESFYQIPGHNVFRGEVLVNKKTYAEKYGEQFTNPRSFVSGVLNRDYSEDEDFYSMRNDLSLVFYDYRQITNGIVKDRDWNKLNVLMSESDYHLGVTPQFFKTRYILNENDFEEVYNQFAEYRHNCPFALDGIVIKPTEDFRINNTTEHRPSDCVAIKFIPMLEETEVVNITWNLGKTGEYTPIIWVNPVNMDGRDVQKCSGHNFGYLKSKGVTIGSKVIMSLAGDIIPFLYKVTQTNDGEIPMPEGETLIDDIHLMAVLNEKDHAKLKFIYSANSLNIPNIGGETAKKIVRSKSVNKKKASKKAPVKKPTTKKSSAKKK
jgi:NAD-dependent DNA ligase